MPFCFCPRSLRLCLLLPALALTLASCRDQAPAEKGGGRRGSSGAAPVYVGKAERKVVPLVLDAVGVVEAIHTAALRSQVTGTILKVSFQEGQDVEAGALLFEIDPRPFKNALNAAEADLERIHAQLDNARLQVKRYSTLNLDEIVTKEQFQQIQVAERVLGAQVVVAENAVSTARLQLEYCSIRAPFAGRTGGLGAREGDLVRASDATISLVTVNQLSPIYVTFGVPQQYLALIARYRSGGTIAVSATPPGDGQPTETGELTFIDNAVDSATGTLKLKATFVNAKHSLWPGQFSSVRMVLDSPHVLVVPASAIQNGQKGQHVFVVKDDLTAELRAVTVERTYENEAVITAGLTEGETVVIDGQFRVAAGRPVEVKTPPTGDAPPPTPKRKKKQP